MCALVPVRIGRIVVVRSNCLSNAPVRHRQLWIKFCGMLKRTRRLVVIEGVNESQALIEELLSLRVLRGNRMMQVPQAGYQHHWMCSSSSMLLGSSTYTQKHPTEKMRQSFHLVNPP